MTAAVEEDCPICNSSDSAKAQFATAKVAEHIKKKARRDKTHRAWIDEHTTNDAREDSQRTRRVQPSTALTNIDGESNSGNVATHIRSAGASNRRGCAPVRARCQQVHYLRPIGRLLYDARASGS